MRFRHYLTGDRTDIRKYSTSLKGTSERLTARERNRKQTIQAKATLLLPVAAVALLSAACGSAANAANSPPSTTATTASSATTNSNNTEHLQSALKALEAIPTFKAPGPPIDASKLAGSTVVIINGDPSAAPPTQTANGVVEAAKVAGLKTKVLNGSEDSTPVEIQLLDQAINLKPMAIVTVAVTPALVKVQLQAAKAAGIPVTIGLQRYHSSATGPSQLAGSLYYGFVTEPSTLEGTILAEQIAVGGPKNAQIGFVSSNVIPLSPQIEAGLKAGLAKYCPGCKVVASQNVDPGNWVTSLSSTVSSMLVAHPSMNYLIPVFDGMTPFVVSALGSSSGGHSVKVITSQGSIGAAMAAIQKGTFASDIGTSSAWEGWALIDQALRAALKLPPETTTKIPLRLVTTSSLNGIDTKSDAAIYGSSYVQGFKTLWGLS